MRKLTIFVFIFSIIGCTSKATLPSDVSGKLEPINHSQVISYE
ncbi:conjugal transfer protein [Salmonella enterica]|nr:conjugal transfer protein [Salmonella enterica]EDQ4123576.1 conjugal transfer protein [Salmonella enterica subsp. enterica serovar Sandiego]